MFRVLNCLETQHDNWLVLLAGCVCLLTSLAAVNLLQRARVTVFAATADAGTEPIGPRFRTSRLRIEPGRVQLRARKTGIRQR